MKFIQDNHRTIGAKRTLSFLGAILLLVTAGAATSCALDPATIVQDTVGPRSASTGTGEEGYLTVYSASFWTTADDLSSSLLSYTDYEVRHPDGSLFQRVVNGDEEPTPILLPKGRYVVVARSDTAGTLSVPVAIEGGRSTTVRLDAGQDSGKGFAGIDSASLVRLPDGQAIGFRARQSERMLSGAPLLATKSKARHPARQQSHS